MMGNPDAKITIVEFGDYQCTFCYKFHDDDNEERLVINTLKHKNVNYHL